MEIRLNLATQPLENMRRFVLASTVAAVVLLAGCFWLGTHALQTWHSNRQMREEVGRLQGELGEFRAQRRDLEEFFRRDETKRAMDRAAFLNGLIEQRSFPWTRIFMDLERLLPTGARVISLSPKREGGRIELHLTIGAQNDESKVKFLKALEEAAQFERVVVMSEARKEGASGEEDPLRLELVALYQAEKEVAKPAAAARAGAQ